MKFKIFVLICLFLLSPFSKGAQIAVVEREKAVIYADRKLSVPIGFIRKGKRIQVGSVKRRGGTILPIVVAGKLSYIRVKDVKLYEGMTDSGTFPPRVTEHDVQESFQDKEDVFSKNNFLICSLSYFPPGPEWEEIEESIGETEYQSMTSFVVNFEHRAPFRAFSWGVGVGYYFLEDLNARIDIFTLEIQTYLNLLRTTLFSFDIKGGILLSGDATVQFSGASVRNTGVMWGYQWGVNGRIFPDSKIGVVAGMGVKSLNLTDLGGFSYSSSSGGDLTLSGVYLHAALSYRF